MQKNYKIQLIGLFIGLLIFASSLLAQNANPNFTFRTLEGSKLNLADLRGQVVVLSFSAKGIPLMRFELPQLNQLATKFGDQVIVLWVSTNSLQPKAANYASDEELRTIASQYSKIMVLRDPTEAAYRQLGTDVLPSILIIDQKGKLVGAPRTGIDPQANLLNDLSPKINQLLNQ